MPIDGFKARWHNPGGGFGFGTSPVPLGDVLEEADLMFILRGDPAVGPRLNVATSSSGLRLSWMTNAVAYRLESTGSLPASVWNTVALKGMSQAA